MSAATAATAAGPVPEGHTAPFERRGRWRTRRTLGMALITAALLATAAFVVFTGLEHHTVTGELSLTDDEAFRP